MPFNFRGQRGDQLALLRIDAIGRLRPKPIRPERTEQVRPDQTLSGHIQPRPTIEVASQQICTQRGSQSVSGRARRERAEPVGLPKPGRRAPMFRYASRKVVPVWHDPDLVSGWWRFCYYRPDIVKPKRAPGAICVGRARTAQSRGADRGQGRVRAAWPCLQWVVRTAMSVTGRQLRQVIATRGDGAAETVEGAEAQ